MKGKATARLSDRRPRRAAAAFFGLREFMSSGAADWVSVSGCVERCLSCGEAMIRVLRKGGGERGLCRVERVYLVDIHGGGGHAAAEGGWILYTWHHLVP